MVLLVIISSCWEELNVGDLTPLVKPQALSMDLSSHNNDVMVVERTGDWLETKSILIPSGGGGPLPNPKESNSERPNRKPKRPPAPPSSTKPLGLGPKSNTELNIDLRSSRKSANLHPKDSSQRSSVRQKEKENAVVPSAAAKLCLSEEQHLRKLMANLEGDNTLGFLKAKDDFKASLPFSGKIYR